MLYNIGALITFVLCIIAGTILTRRRKWVKTPTSALISAAIVVSLSSFIAIFWPAAVPAVIVATGLAKFLWDRPG